MPVRTPYSQPMSVAGRAGIYRIHTDCSHAVSEGNVPRLPLRSRPLTRRGPEEDGLCPLRRRGRERAAAAPQPGWSSGTHETTSLAAAPGCLAAENQG